MTGIQCQDCRHFEPDSINPAAGAGRCLHDAQHGCFYPMERHLCRDFNDSTELSEASADLATGSIDD